MGSGSVERLFNKKNLIRFLQPRQEGLWFMRQNYWILQRLDSSRTAIRAGLRRSYSGALRGGILHDGM